jgi:hypothetical protein
MRITIEKVHYRYEFKQLFRVWLAETVEPPSPRNQHRKTLPKNPRK